MPKKSTAKPTAKQTDYTTIRKRVQSLKPSPENLRLYRPVDEADPAIQQLAESIRQRGLHQPLVITKDNFIVSGHRRLTALKAAGQKQAPCQVLPVRRKDLSTDEFITLLRDHNRQRDKSAAEQISETLVDVDPSQAAVKLRQRREQARRRYESHQVFSLDIEGCSRRSVISDQKSEHVRYAKQVVFTDRREYWPLNVRAVHYALLNYAFLRNTKQKLAYKNDQPSYHSTSDLLTRMRLNGDIPWDAIGDETRPVQEYHAFHDVRDFIRQDIERLFDGYWRDTLQSQPNYVELLVEKNTVLHMAMRVTERYQVPTSSARGFSSIDHLHEIRKRFLASGKERLILIVLSDFDPEGELIPHNAGRILRDDFGIEELEIVKAGVTRQQIEEYDLPPQNFAKESSSNHKWFTNRNGGDGTVWELEALEPQAMLSHLDSTIQAVLDMKLFEAELARETEDAVTLEQARQAAAAALRGLRF